MSTSVRNGVRSGDELTEGSYIRAISLFTIIVSGVVAGGAAISYSWAPTALLFIGAIVAAVVCIIMFQSSDVPIISFIGVSGMSLALAVILGPALHSVQMDVVLEAVVITAVIMSVMSVVGIMAPSVFKGFGPYLLAGLSLLIVAQFAQIICVLVGFPEAVHMPMLDWIGIGIFTLYVAYDWSSALSLPLTLDNAIDTSGSLILDAVNLFIRIVSLLSGSSSTSSD